ncbi:MAG TPA: DUF1206 domain-containing protein [Planctomycetota bacterium]|nr:DUF1206 domain-containing protein [Planctomycetota bacterium]
MSPLHALNDTHRLTQLARAGHAARGVVYALIGVLAFKLAIGDGGEAAGPGEALKHLADEPFGAIALWVIAVGLAAFAVWRFIDGAGDKEGKGSEGKGLVVRAGFIGSGAVHAAMALTAAGIAMGSSSGGGGDSSAQGWSADLLAQPFGRWLLGAIALGFIAHAGAQVRKAWKGSFLKHVATDRLEPGTVRAVRMVGGAGIAARGLAWALIGGFLIVAAVTYDASRAQGLGGALGELMDKPFGPWLLGIMAAGLVAFGIYNLVLGRYFVIRRG